MEREREKKGRCVDGKGEEGGTNENRRTTSPAPTIIT
jgi:hypothetical protein